MSDHFADRLYEAIRAKSSVVCVGIDPILDMLPPASGRRAKPPDPADLDSSLDAIHDFCRTVLEIIAPYAPIVKFQSAYFEKYLWEGVQIYYELIAEAKQLGLLTIGDVKRGDIGSTSAAYAQAHLADPQFELGDDASTPDAITINPMLGLDTLQPFLDVASEYRKGVFVLVRTSNPGSSFTQDVHLADGRTWSEMLADGLNPLAETMIGKEGYSALGAVVGATQTQTMASLRGRLPKSFFLLPGYGTQGATAEMTQAAFINGGGAIVSASRSILYAQREPRFSGRAWQDAVLDAAKQMVDDLKQITQKH